MGNQTKKGVKKEKQVDIVDRKCRNCKVGLSQAVFLGGGIRTGCRPTGRGQIIVVEIWVRQR